MASRGRTKPSRRERFGYALQRGYERIAHVVRPSSPAFRQSGGSAPLSDIRHASPPPPTIAISLQTSSHPNVTEGPNNSGKQAKTVGLGNDPAPNAARDKPAASPEPAAGGKPRSNGQRPLAGLENALRALGLSASAFPPLESVVGELVECLDIVQSATANAEDYNRLTSELTTMATSLNKSIEAEVTRIRNKLERGKGRQLFESTRDKEDVIASYRIIEGFFRQLQADINVRILGNTNRLTDINLQILGNTNRLLPQRVLSLLQGMSPVDDARYDSSYSMTVKRRACTPETREKVQADLQNWIHDPNGAKVYWMNGMAGTGKTTIAYSLCEWLEANKLLGASFFCSRVSSSCRNVNLIVPTIACQLARHSSVFRSALCEALENDPDIGKLNVVRQFERLLRDPLTKLKHGDLEGTAVVIDALDECDDEYGVRLIIGTLLKLGTSLPIKFFVTSRPEPAIRDGMMSPGGHSPAVLHLHDIEQSIVEGDIKRYLDSEFEFVSLAPSRIDQLVKRAGNLFIYAATAVRYILSGRGDPTDRLNAMLAIDSRSIRAGQYSKKYKELDGLYATVLAAVLNDEELEQVEVDRIRLVLWTVICVKEPLAIPALSSLLGLTETQIVSSLRCLYSVLHISQGQGLVSTLHASFPEYMLDIQRSKDFCCNEVLHSTFLSDRCFDTMKNELRFNICRLESSLAFDEDVPDLNQRIATHISTTLSYACHYWGEHLWQSGPSAELCTELAHFLEYRLLSWMEVLNLKRSVGKGISVLMNAEKWVLTHEASGVLHQRVGDTRDFVSRFAAGACNRSTPHIYLSALPFCAKSSSVYAHYWGRTRGLMDVRGTAISQRSQAAQATWSTNDYVYSVAYSPDGTKIAAGCRGGFIWVWEAHTGDVVVGPLEENTGSVNSIAFSPDSTRLVSGSDDSTIRVWDTRTGNTVAGPFDGHSGSVRSVAFSPDGMRIVSGSNDKTVRLWDANTGHAIAGPLEGHEQSVKCVAFSPDGVHVASGSADTTIRVWSTHTGGLVSGPFTGHSDSVESIAFSPDGAHIVSGSVDETIRVWDARTGDVIAGPLKAHVHTITSVAFSPDGTRIVSGSHDENSLVWDAHTGDVIAGPFRGHTNMVKSVTFSPDGTRIVTGSNDRTVRVWDTRTGVVAEGLSARGHAHFVTSVAFSPNSALIASGSHDKTVRVWDAHTGDAFIQPLKGHTDSIRSVAFSPKSTHLASGSDDTTVRVWDVRTGECVAQPFRGHSGPVMCVIFSPDGTRAVSGSQDTTIRVWDSGSGHTVAGPFNGHTFSVNSVAFSPDGVHIVSGSTDRTIRVWDTCTGEIVVPPFEDSTRSIESAVFSPDGACVVSCSSAEGIRVRDMRTRSLTEGPFPGGRGRTNMAIFSQDGVRIASVSGDDDTIIIVWDAHTSEVVAGPFKGHTRPVQSVAFSPDGTCIVSGSADQAIRVSYCRHGTTANIPYFKLLQSTSTAPSDDEDNSESGPRESSDIVPTTSPSAAPSPAPHDHSPEETLTGAVDFECREDGWVTSGGARLFWTPPDLRAHIPSPQDRVVIGYQGSMSINYENLLLGERWTECYKP